MKKRADGRYCTQIFIGYKPDGTRVMKTVYGKTKREVEQKEREIRAQIDMGLNISHSISLGDWADEWLETYKSSLSPYTVRRYKSIVNVHIKPNIGKLKVDRVRVSHVQKLLNSLSDYSISSVKKVRHTFCTMLYNAGVDIKTAQSILGHADASITLRVYTHLSERQKSANISKLNEYINKAC